MQSSDAAVVTDLKSSDAVVMVVGMNERRSIIRLRVQSDTGPLKKIPEKCGKNASVRRVLDGCLSTGTRGLKPDTRTWVDTHADTLPSTGKHSTPGCLVGCSSRRRYQTSTAEVDNQHKASGKAL
ncbi:hypothetical protein BDZ89DRAFT_1046339 [Hymenopellis radicata]|nr:hypothetical protein BDZ89DRAFT_1046339 [Hymenopellis radicata]